MNERKTLAQLESPPVPRPPVWDSLTRRERDVAIGLATGNSNDEIAKLLGTSVRTVETHRANIMKKLQLKNNVALCRLLIRKGLVQP
jgi:DNA-binding NarL/FixJ family response regulator